MKKILLSALFTVFFAGAVSAQEFSADMISTMGGKTMASKIYVSKDKVRTEMPGAVTIVRGDKQVSWIIMPEEKMYMEHPIDLSKAPKTTKEIAGESQRESLGMEVLDGQQVEKFKVTYNEGRKSMSVYQWIKDGQIPVKIEAVDGSWSMEYKNISTAPQPAELFEPPAGYEKMAMPSMGNLLEGFMR